MKTVIKNYPLAAFTVLALAVTWLGSLVYTFAIPGNRALLPAFLGTPSAVLWYYGPCLAAIIVTQVTGGGQSVRRLLRRLLDWKVKPAWYFFIAAYPLGLHLCVLYLDQLLGGPAPVFFKAEGVPAGQVWLVLPGLALFQVLVRGIGEEVGWRGFALPLLQQRFHSLAASLILGVVWGLWHFHPANFPALLNPGGIFLFFNIMLTTVIMTWVYNHTRGSLFIAALFHMTLNIAEYVAPLGMAQAGLSRQVLQIALIIATGAALVLVSRPDLGKKDENDAYLL